jgi:hypothetical protein
VDIAKTQRLGLARPIDGERVDPALGEIETREDDAHFLGVVHAVEQHDSRAPAAARALHEIGGQARVLVGNLDALDPGMQALHGRVVGPQRLVIHRQLFRPGRDKALGAVVIVARAHVVVAGGDMVLLRRGGVGDGDDPIRHRGPFLAPDAIEIGFPGACLEPPADPIDLVHRNRTVGRHPFDDLHGVAPAQVAGKMHGPSTSQSTSVGADAAAVINRDAAGIRCHYSLPP